MSGGPRPPLGVVIPTLDEAERLPLLLDDLESLPLPHQVVVVDGGSTDGTRELARARGTKVLTAAPGRASQMNRGAASLQSRWLLFLHADCRLPEESGQALAAWILSASTDASAHFRFRLEGSHWFWRFLELGQGVRERLFGLAYGDQGLLVSRETFDGLGGFPEIPVMEDVEFLARLRRAGPVERLPAPLVTSPRRYESEGRWRGWLRNTLLVSLHSVGVPARRLARYYLVERDRRPAGARPRTPRTLIVFAKAPTPGRVKTRLARSLGSEEATRLYRSLGRRVVDQVRAGAYRTIVYFDPPGAESELRNWLGEEGVAFRPQAEGDLGQRMERAFAECFRESERVCIVGTDAPAVDRARIDEAFEALDRAEVVFGPALDGGYYLLALSRPRPDLFRDIPWSTGEVLTTSAERARERGLRPHFLAPLRDVDTVEDLREGAAGER